MEKLANSHQTGSIWESQEILQNEPRPNKQLGSFQGVDGCFSTSPEERRGVATVNHFMNRVRTQAGQFSCAIDCFLELWHHSFRHVFTEISDNELFFLANQMSAYYEYVLAHNPSESDLQNTREPVWDYLRQKCPSFTAMDCNAQFSEIFTSNVFSNLTSSEKSKVISTYSSIGFCEYCNEDVIRNTEVLLNYVSLSQLSKLNVPTFHWYSALMSSNIPRSLQCSQCERSCERIDAQSEMSMLLFVELSSNVFNCIQFQERIVVCNVHYYLLGVVRNLACHFTCAVCKNGQWYLFDDLCSNLPTFNSVHELFQHAIGGWFFAVYIKSQSDIFPEITMIDVSVNDQFEMSSILPDTRNAPHKIFDDNNISNRKLHNKRRREKYQESDNSLRNLKRKAEYFSQKGVHFISQNECDKLPEKGEGLQPSKTQNKGTLNKETAPRILCVNNNEIKNSNNISNSQLHENEKAIINNRTPAIIDTSLRVQEESYANSQMKAFHNSMKMKIYQCSICKEGWPQRIKKLERKQFICRRCSIDKKEPKLFSFENNMIPSVVPEELSILSQCEEILIARAFPVIQVYTKAGGSYGYKGHVINLPNNVQHIADILPHNPKDLPIIAFTVKGKNDFEKEFKVRRQVVLDALQWLILNNPLYKDIQIDYSRISALPADGFLFVQTIDFHEQISTEPCDTGPSNSDTFDENVIDDVNISSFVPQNPSQELEDNIIMDGVQRMSTGNSLDIGSNPIDEFTTQYLASLAFPTLFPDTRGDPTNSALKRDIANSDTEAFAKRIKHLAKFAELKDGKYYYRFSAHPRFAYWAYNMLYRKRLLGQGNFYIKQTPNERLLSVDELRNLLDSGNYTQVMSKILHYAKNVTGTNAYWNENKENLRALMMQKGIGTIFWTLSFAEYHLPEIHTLFDTANDSSMQNYRQNVFNNPHIMVYMFTERVEAFVKHWLYQCLGAEWHWFRYEFAVQRGSIHCHGIAKLKSDPGLCDLSETALRGYLASKKLETCSNEHEIATCKQEIDDGLHAEQKICNYHDYLVSTWNPTNPAEFSKPAIHPCKRRYDNIPNTEFTQDYSDLVNTVQRHTKCNSGYCLRQDASGNQKCRFGFPIEPADVTHLRHEKINSKTANIEQYRTTVVSKRNDTRINRHQRLQLQGWRANCDIQLIIDHHACVEYLAKYASKGEKMSSIVRDAFVSVVSHLKDDTSPKTAIRKLMMKAVGQRDMSIQEVMHQILGLKLFSSTFQVITVSLDGTYKLRMVDGELQKEPSHLDRYAERQSVECSLKDINFINFFSCYDTTKKTIVKRKSEIIVKTIPRYSSNPQSRNYGLFCKYQLIKYKPWQGTVTNCWNNEEESSSTFVFYWNAFLSSKLGQTLVPGWHRELQNSETFKSDPTEMESQEITANEQREEWMLVSEMARSLENNGSSDNILLTHLNESRNAFSKDQINSMPFWIESNKEATSNAHVIPTSKEIDLSLLNKEQKRAYDIVLRSYSVKENNQLLMIITGQAGSGKSFLIDCLRQLLGSACIVCAFFGIAAFNVEGQTLHSLFHLPIRGRSKHDLKGPRLAKLQANLKSIKYLIIDEFSVIGQRMFGWIDRRCKQGKANNAKPFGGISVILVGDIAQLPPIGDKLLLDKKPKGDVALQGFCCYSSFKTVVHLQQNQRVQSPSQENFRGMLLRLRNGQSTEADWQQFLTRDVSLFTSEDLDKFDIKLAFGNETVAEHNFSKLTQGQYPFMTIKARHNSVAAAKLASEEFCGLQPVIHLAKGAPVMLTKNLWVQRGLCNGSIGTVQHVIFAENDFPPSLPLAVLVRFERYTGPSFTQQFRNCVPIAPFIANADGDNESLERQQLPLKLCYAMTIHKSQGLTLGKATVDLGKQEAVAGLAYVALSRVCQLQDLAVVPMSYERLTAINRHQSFLYRIEEEKRLAHLASITEMEFTSIIC